MSSDIPSSGLIKVRVMAVNSLHRGDLVHDIRARILPREAGVRPVHISIRDEFCTRPPMVGDRLRLTMQAGAVAGVEALKPKSRAAAATDDQLETHGKPGGGSGE